jgi:hypothetical protein
MIKTLNPIKREKTSQECRILDAWTILNNYGNYIDYPIESLLWAKRVIKDSKLVPPAITGYGL